MNVLWTEEYFYREVWYNKGEGDLQKIVQDLFVS